jgi:predicted phage-related endonuclease
MSLTSEQLKARDGKLTASRVACLMTGSPEKIMNLWREMVGDPSFVDDDLSGVWPVQLGSTTENLNLDWYTRRTGRKLTRRGEVVVHPVHTYAAATLDGYDAELGAVIECKHVGGFEPRATVVDRYVPQVQWQMMVTECTKAVLSIIEGGREPVLEEIAYDAAYCKELWTRAAAFMLCVRTLSPPVALAAVAAPVKPAKVYDMASSNTWATHAAAWLASRSPAKSFETATKELKALVAADAAKAHGHGIVAVRDGRGVTIKEA